MKQLRTICQLTFLVTLFLSTDFIVAGSHNGHSEQNTQRGDDNYQAKEVLLSDVRQLVSLGKKSGEGYFSSDGKKMVFQAELEGDNPFYQIFLMDLETKQSTKISGGTGRTTCAWIHPNQDKVLFSSTHLDPDTLKKQAAEIEVIKLLSPGTRRPWVYDEHYDIFEYDTNGNELKRLTTTKGYDAEASWSPDGSTIVFGSNRTAYEYEKELSPVLQEIRNEKPEYFMEIYTMDANGQNVKRLTNTPGYDGGPFYSADGQKITWRRFQLQGRIAEIFVMNADGTDQKPITRLNSLSWAPFFHPSGEYIIFATAVQGFRNFELYMVDSEGKSDPVRVTFFGSADVLPVFTPNGQNLAWVSKRTQDKSAHIFLAKWNHELAREKLGIK